MIFTLSCNARGGFYYVGVLQWTERIEVYREAYRGVVDGLEEKGFVEGKNLRIEYVNVEQDWERARATVEEWVVRGVELIITLGTGSTLAAMRATSTVPIVYTIVGDPMATGLTAPNVTGTSMKIPVYDQLKMALAFVPGVKTLGVLHCAEMPQAVVTAKEALKVAPYLGLEAEEMVLDRSDLASLEEILVKNIPLIDLLYIPTDPVMHDPEVFRRIYRVAMAYEVPVVGVSKDVVERGALLAYHPDFYEIGRQAAHQAALVLSGVPMENIPSEGPIVRLLSFNLSTARRLSLPVDRNLLQRVDNIYY